MSIYRGTLPKIEQQGILDVPQARSMILIWSRDRTLRGVLFDKTSLEVCADDNTQLPFPTSDNRSCSTYAQCPTCECLYEFYTLPSAK